jgi:YVTN family beta-propeller protein
MLMRMKAVLVVLVVAASASAQTPMLAVSVRGENAVHLYNVIGGAGLGAGLLQLGKSVPVGKQPGEMCLAPNAKNLFVSNVGDRTVSMIDLEKKTVVAALSDRGMQSPDGCAVSPDSKKLYSVDQEAAAVFVFSLESKQMVTKIAVGKEPRRAIFSPDGKRLLVSNAHSDNLSVIDPATDEVVKTVKTGTEPRDMTYSPDGKLLAVGLINDDCVQFFKADNLEPKQQVGVVRSPQHMEFSPDGQRLYVVGKLTDDIGIVHITELARLVRTIPLTPGRLGQTRSWGMAMSPDGRFLYVTNMGEDSISLIDFQLTTPWVAIPAGKAPVAAIYIKPTGGGIAAMGQAARLERFRSLAQSAMAAVKKNDLAAAAKFCQTLELEWDEGETALRQSSPDVWSQIDEAMDQFIHPIMRAGGTAPDAAALNTVYQNFLAKLKLVR